MRWTALSGRLGQGRAVSALAAAMCAACAAPPAAPSPSPASHAVVERTLAAAAQDMYQNRYSAADAMYQQLLAQDPNDADVQAQFALFLDPDRLWNADASLALAAVNAARAQAGEPPVTLDAQLSAGAESHAY